MSKLLDWSVMSLDESYGGGGPPPTQADTEVSPLPVVKSYEEFIILSSTKQNIELYKFLRAISREIQNLKTSVETRMNDIEMMIAKDDADANATKVLSVAPKNDSPTKSTLHADATLAGPDDSFDDNATLRNVVKLWQSTTLSSHAGNGGHGGDDVDESADSQLMKNRDMDRPVTLNVGGKKFEVPKRR